MIKEAEEAIGGLLPPQPDRVVAEDPGRQKTMARYLRVLVG